MDLALSPQELEFRARFRKFLAAHPAPRSHDAFTAGLEWQRTLHEERWVAPHWPYAFGGQGCSLTEYSVFLAEIARHPAPQIANRVGVNMVGATLLAHGTQAQKDRYLPSILAADEIWCQLFSEPDAGSDLLSISTRANRDGDSWVVSGQKVWSSFGAHADMGALLARTEPDAASSRAFTYFVCDMRAPGIEVRPLRQMTGETEFAEVFLDDVRIPDDCVIAEPGAGWAVMRTTLAQERGLSFPLKEQGLQTAELDELLDIARASPKRVPAHLRQRLAADYIRLEIFRYLNLRTLTELSRDTFKLPSASVIKLCWAELSQEIQETAGALQGMDAVVGDADLWAGLLWSRQASIAGGTSEIQRNIIAEQLLGLPRDPAPSPSEPSPQ